MHQKNLSCLGLNIRVWVNQRPLNIQLKARLFFCLECSSMVVENSTPFPGLMLQNFFPEFTNNRVKLIFVPCKSFRLSRMLAGKARSLPQTGVPERFITRAGFSPLTLDYAGKARQVQAHFLQISVLYTRLRFYNIGSFKNWIVDHARRQPNA